MSLFQRIRQRREDDRIEAADFAELERRIIAAKRDDPDAARIFVSPPPRSHRLKDRHARDAEIHHYAEVKSRRGQMGLFHGLFRDDED